MIKALEPVFQPPAYTEECQYCGATTAQTACEQNGWHCDQCILACLPCGVSIQREREDSE